MTQPDFTVRFRIDPTEYLVAVNTAATRLSDLPATQFAEALSEMINLLRDEWRFVPTVDVEPYGIGTEVIVRLEPSGALLALLKTWATEFLGEDEATDRE